MSNDAMATFFEQLTAACVAALTDPPRLLTFRHLANVAALKFPRLSPSTRQLLDGFIYEMIAANRICRLQTVSRLGQPYQVLFACSRAPAVERSLEAIQKLMHKTGFVSLEEVSQATEFTTNHDVEVLFGNLVYHGSATVSAFDGSPLLVIRAPHAA